MADNLKLSLEDVAKLIEDKSSEAKIVVANKIANQYKSKGFTAEQLRLAEQIFRLLLRDAEVHVRKILSENLKDIGSIPKDVILELAKDVSEVSIPVLEFSEVLNDEDLVSIINGTLETAKHIAITKRNSLSESISEALVDTKNEEVVKNLLNNQSAAINSDSFDKIIKEFPDNVKLIEQVVDHRSITVEVTEKILEKVSSAIKEKIEIKYLAQKNKIDEAFDKTKEVAAIKLMGAEGSDEELISLINFIDKHGSNAEEIYSSHSKIGKIIERLEEIGKLTPLTALCMGNLNLFEITMARIAKIPVFNVKKLLIDKSGMGFKALYEKTNLPESTYDAVKLITDVVIEMQQLPKEQLDKLKNSEHKSNYMIERVMSLSEGKQIDNISYFLSMIKIHSQMNS